MRDRKRQKRRSDMVNTCETLRSESKNFESHLFGIIFIFSVECFHLQFGKVWVFQNSASKCSTVFNLNRKLTHFFFCLIEFLRFACFHRQTPKYWSEWKMKVKKRSSTETLEWNVSLLLSQQLPKLWPNIKYSSAMIHCIAPYRNTHRGFRNSLNLGKTYSGKTVTEQQRQQQKKNTNCCANNVSPQTIRMNICIK